MMKIKNYEKKGNRDLGIFFLILYLIQKAEIWHKDACSSLIQTFLSNFLSSATIAKKFINNDWIFFSSGNSEARDQISSLF